MSGDNTVKKSQGNRPSPKERHKKPAQTIRSKDKQGQKCQCTNFPSKCPQHVKVSTETIEQAPCLSDNKPPNDITIDITIDMKKRL
jgi:hypothetical protein